LNPVRFIHASDAHLGYRQYHLQERQQDFMNAFQEFVEKTKELSPDFIVFAGDLFNDPHPSNVVLSSAIESIDSLKLPFLVVPGSHDAVYSSSVGTVLDPLHKGGHIQYLPLKPFEFGEVYVTA
jgi:DNA repair exonuclease SbcCD nuclease subunit